jgi:hypothetical protein
LVGELVPGDFVGELMPGDFVGETIPRNTSSITSFTDFVGDPVDSSSLKLSVLARLG